jgi:hypothetical protein
MGFFGILNQNREHLPDRLAELKAGKNGASSEDETDSEFGSIVNEVKNMSPADIEQAIIETIAEGDLEEYTEDASTYYLRAIALSGLSKVRSEVKKPDQEVPTQT